MSSEYFDDRQQENVISGSDFAGQELNYGEAFSVESGMPALDRMINKWGQYQCMMAFSHGGIRNESGHDTGSAAAFRDSCQSILGVVHMAPEKSRERLAVLAKTLCGRLNSSGRLRANVPGEEQSLQEDDPVWFIKAVCAYIFETGDYGILNEPCPLDGRESVSGQLLDVVHESFRYSLREHDRKMNRGNYIFTDAFSDYALLCDKLSGMDEFASLNSPGNIEMRSMCMKPTSSAGAGPGVVRSARIDFHDEARLAWKQISDSRLMEDGLLPGEDPDAADGGRTEDDGSEEDFRDFCTKFGFSGVRRGSGTRDTADSGRAKNDVFSRKYMEDFRDFCTKFGFSGVRRENSSETDSRQSDSSNSASGDGSTEQTDRTPDSSGLRFADDETGGRSEPSESGGIYDEMAAAADTARLQTMLGNGDAAWEQVEEMTLLTGDDPGNTNISGIALRAFVTISRYILGIRPVPDGLAVDPCIPADYRGFKLRRVFRGVTYNITVDNSAGVQKGVSAVLMDGRALDGNVIPVPDNIESCDVLVTMG